MKGVSDIPRFPAYNPFNSIKEAEQAGYVACKVCAPEISVTEEKPNVNISQIKEPNTENFPDLPSAKTQASTEIALESLQKAMKVFSSSPSNLEEERQATDLADLAVTQTLATDEVQIVKNLLKDSKDALGCAYILDLAYSDNVSISDQETLNTVNQIIKKYHLEKIPDWARSTELTVIAQRQMDALVLIVKERNKINNLHSTQGNIAPSAIPPPPSSVTVTIPKPLTPQAQTYPAGASALCRDGTYSYSQSRRGTCSHHGGVAQWLY